ncbi:MAG: ABC transporter permease [Gammaproteobacteria bacterium RIFCSPLOWO2_12_FULL_52_10]|nr:MAG: ABC transporter permease [Gammaproteobacteria bacterium RIFCSPLOWO2_12_FULL_52_10]
MRARTLYILSGLCLLSLVSIVFALSIGSMEIGLQQVLNALFSDQQLLESRVVLELRLPRVIAGFMVGGMLALAGCLMQVLLRNPLAEPYVLGVSGGASVFALLVMMAGLTGIWINIGAFTGALISILLVFGLTRMGQNWNPMRVLLTGVVVAAGWSALISFLLAVSPATQIYNMLFWLMGDLGYARFSGFSLVVLLVCLGASLFMARSLNLLTYGDQQAAVLGVPVNQLRYGIYFLASLLTATAVMQAGSIGFIGLIIPHLIRIALGSDHRLLIPASVLTGGCLLIIADSLARTIIAPQQLPVGVLTAIIGVPVFLALFQVIVFKQKP